MAAAKSSKINYASAGLNLEARLVRVALEGRAIAFSKRIAVHT